MTFRSLKAAVVLGLVLLLPGCGGLYGMPLPGGADMGSNPYHVTVRFADEAEASTYQLVGSAEASPADGRLSVESPLGQALVGRVAGDELTVQTPGGPARLAVVAVGARG